MIRGMKLRDLHSYTDAFHYDTQVGYVEGEEDALPLKERSMDCEFRSSLASILDTSLREGRLMLQELVYDALRRSSCFDLPC